MDDEATKTCTCGETCDCKCNTSGCANCAVDCACAPKEEEDPEAEKVEEA